MSYNDVPTFRSYSITSGSFDGVSDNVIQSQLDVAYDDINSALLSQFPSGGLPFPSGSVPSTVLDAERGIAAYRLWMVLGFDPGTEQSFLHQRYLELVGVPEKPDSGLLGMWAFGRRKLAADNAVDPAPQRTGWRVGAGKPRSWYARSRNGKDVLT